MRSKIIVSVFVAYSLLTVICNAQWELDVRLTNDTAESLTSFGAWCVAANADIVHVVWHDFRNGDSEVYYKRSTDSGLTWGKDIRLTYYFNHSRIPSVAVSGPVVHVVWEDARDYDMEVYYKRSTDVGISWGRDKRLTNKEGYSGYPVVSAAGSIVHVVWGDNHDGNPEIYYKRSTDAGISWSPDIRLTYNQYASGSSSVSVSGSLVNVIWSDNRDGNYEIYYKRSIDAGISWGTDTRLTYDPAASYEASVSASGSVVHVVWRDHRDGNEEIYYKKSSDNGLSWGDDTRLTFNPSVSVTPVISAYGSNVHIVWTDLRDGDPEIYYKRSTDSGFNWDSCMRLTNSYGYCACPSVSVFGMCVHVVWADKRDGNWEIYYKRNPAGNPISIKPISTEFPKKFRLYQNYPNPFNPSTTIEFDIPSRSFVKLVVYDVLGREVSRLVNETLSPGQYNIKWEGSTKPSGVYYYRLEAEGLFFSGKMILLK